MSLKLRKVELKNIRSHEHVIFEPESVGITALQGVNGSGKSTIVDSIAWVLFGTKPDGVSKGSEIFRADAELADEAWAQLDFDVAGKHMRFRRKRVNKSGKTECEVWEVDDEAGDPKLVAGPATSHAEPFIRKTLGMDEAGFLAAILVQQKQVDQLIAAKPAERGAVIEKLTGIAGISAALIQARQDYNSLKKAATFSSADPAALEQVKKEEQKERANLESLRTSAARLRAQAGEIKGVGNELRAKLAEATKLYEERQQVEAAIAEASTTLKLKQEAFAELSKEKDRERKALAGQAGVSFDEVSEKFEQLKQQRDELRSEKGIAEHALKVLQQQLKTKAERAKELDAIEGDMSELELEVQSLSQEEKRLNALVKDRESQIKQLNVAVKALSHDKCPTCLQQVDDPHEAVAALEATVESYEAEVATTETEVSDVVLKREAAEELTKKLKEKAAIDAVMRDLLSEESALKVTVDTSASELRVLEQELKKVSEQFDEAKQHRDRAAAYKRLLSQVQKLADEIDQLEHKLSALKKQESAMSSSSKQAIDKMQQKLEETRAKHSSVVVDYTKESGELKLKEQKLEFLASEIERLTTDLKKHEQLVNSVAVASHSVELVAEFRENRIKNSIPIIEDYASELLNRFTDGKFNRLTLDHKFNATVYLSDGTERSVGLLSGGELSAAAMSLRLAVAMLLNNGADQNVVILDEVLVSQDTARAELILTTIRETFQGQVVLIAHNEAIDAVADKIVALPAR